MRRSFPPSPFRTSAKLRHPLILDGLSRLANAPTARRRTKRSACTFYPVFKELASAPTPPQRRGIGRFPSPMNRLRGNLPILLEDSFRCQLPPTRGTTAHLPGLLSREVKAEDESDEKKCSGLDSSEHRLGAPHRGHASNPPNICGTANRVNLGPSATVTAGCAPSPRGHARGTPHAARHRRYGRARARESPPPAASRARRTSAPRTDAGIEAPQYPRAR